VLGDLCHAAHEGHYSAATIDYIEAASGEIIPDIYRGDGGALAQQTVMLRYSRRFGGPIGQLALAVNGGDTARAEQVLRYAPYLQLLRDGASGEHEDWVRRILLSFETFRILCAVRDGEWGVAGLNEAIEKRLAASHLLRHGAEWYVGRPVMVTRNDYSTRVFNGDIGVTLPDPARAGALRVYFLEGDAVRSVLATRLRNVETAFAMTVHKSQGSEFRHTVLALPRERNAVLTRELVYTGITRASEVFTLVTPGGDVLQEAIASRTHRTSGLRDLVA
jgi:exodeoxyribonuclease V alpha subunit